MPAETKTKAASTKPAAAGGAKTKTKPKNDVLAPYVKRFGKRKWRSLTGRFFKWTKATKAGKTPAAVKPKKALKTKPFNKKKNETRSILPKPKKMYPAEVAPRPLPSARALRPAKIRSSLKAGTVVILLAGRYKGMRAVILKHLPSGLLVITGKFVCVCVCVCVCDWVWNESA
jgi:large subunit ribosomal protein L6e